uniref:DUF6589 domain-containing protein n=1 Tax=Magallana gigas TaxID=29159 RepID=A0A8W8NTK5_MAGGI
MCSDNICQFHYNVQRRQKRMPKTPPSTLKSTVAEQIEHSVEKLKHISLEEERKPKKSKQKLSFNTSEAATDTQVIDTPDHGYCRPKLVQSKEQDDKVTISEMMERFSVNVSQSICNSVEQVSRFGKSVLFTKETGELCKRNWFKDIAIEMSEKCPELFQVLFSAIGDKISMESKLATISTIYGMILHCHNVKACAVQRIFTALCIRYHADNKLLERLNKVHFTLSHETKRNLLKDFAEFSDFRIIEKVSEGKDGKINGDNLDIYVTTNDIRMDNKNRDYHFFASDFVFDRIKTENLDNTKSLKDIGNITWKDFVPTSDEDLVYKKSLQILLGRIISMYPGYASKFEWMKSVLPQHIEHVQDDAMSQKSEVCWMPVLMKNETCYSDCIQIMKSYEKQILQWYTKGGRANDLDKLKIPVGGDQLTRVRLQGAKACQDGALTAADRLEHMEPIIVEMFHTLQDLLEKMYKRFYKTSSGRDKGTLYNLKLIIERSNVNGNVKSRFEAHEDFVLTVGNAYLLSFIMNKFGMETLDAEPQHPLLKNRNIKFMHNKYKEEVFHTIMGEIVEDLICTFPKLDAIKEGDSDRTNITLKFCIPIFFSHSILSKYLEECVDYILKTEVLLTEKLAMKVRYGSFVNLTGHKGENKAADLQKENEVLVLKELIRGLGSNKTEKAIDTITKAAPVIQDIVDNFDKMSNISHRNTHHRKRSSEGDIKCILKVIVPLKIWNYTEGRTLESFKKIKKSPFDFERCQFKEAINRKIQRLKRGISVPESSDEESDQE